jgi:hypothetical protein
MEERPMARGGKRPGAGRPKGRNNKKRRRILAIESASVVELARQHSVDAVKALAHIALNGRSENARVSAANALLDRGYGRPPMQVDVSARSQVDVIHRGEAEFRKALIDRGIPANLLPPLLAAPNPIDGDNDRTKHNE